MFIGHSVEPYELFELQYNLNEYEFDAVDEIREEFLKCNATDDLTDFILGSTTYYEVVRQSDPKSLLPRQLHSR